MNHDGRASFAQIIGGLILALTTIVPAMALAGFHGGTGWSILFWLFLSVVGGGIGGALVVPSHRIAGFVGGMVAGPTGLLGVYLYAQGRDRMFKAEAVIVWLIASLPGIGVYFVGRLLTDALFPARSDDDRGPRRRRKRRAYDDEDDEPRPKRRREVALDDEEPRPKKRRRARYEEE